MAEPSPPPVEPSATAKPVPVSKAVRPSRARIVGGIILMSFGVLLAGGAGLCTIVFAGGGSLNEAIAPLVFGGPAVLLGLLCVWGGAVKAFPRPKSAEPGAGPEG